MQNLPLCILIIVLIFVGFGLAFRENFSSSGLTISNDYCNNLADVYYRPTDTNETNRLRYREQICGQQRRHTIDRETGNYFTEGGILI